jgi:phosphoglycerate dehydrogenase-like enzyme
VTRIAVLDDYQGVALQMADWGRLPAGASVEAFRDHIFEQDALVKRLEPFEVICAMRERTPFPGALLRRLPNLKLLITTGMRNASFDMATARELGITVSGTGGTRGGTSELTWGLILALARKIPLEDADVRRGGWQATVGEGLDGKVLGVIGLGNLGSLVAQAGKAFNMEVIAWSQNLTAGRAAQFGARLVSKGELLTQADFVTIHLVLGDRSRGLIGANELALMKPTAYLINTSRGPIVDEAALIDALRNRRIAGAGLDVFDVEPLPADHPFRSLPNTVITPHLGYVTAESYRVYHEHMVEDIIAFLEGKPVRVIE